MSQDQVTFAYIKGDYGRRIGVVAFQYTGDTLQVGASFLNPSDDFDPSFGREIAEARLRETPVVRELGTYLSNRELVKAALTLATRSAGSSWDPTWKGVSSPARRAVRKLYGK